MATVENLEAVPDPPNSAIMAVLFADMVSFSRHIAQDEQAAVSQFEAMLAVAHSLCADFKGRLIKSTGDGFLVVFPTASQAVGFATTLQDGHADSTVKFRIGIHSGEVMLRGDDVFGHTVNFASRIEGWAPEGGVCVSHDVFSLIRRSEQFQLEAIGAHRLKNIDGRHMLYVARKSTRKPDVSTVGLTQIETIGGLRIVQEGGAAQATLDPFCENILACLALSPGQSESVERLESVIGDPDARSITEAINRLQQVLGDALDCTGGAVRLTKRLLQVDLIEAESRLKQGEIPAFFVQDRAWPDRLVSGLRNVSPQFSAWLEVSRAEWKERFAVLLEDVLDRLPDDDPAIRECATALLVIEDAHEAAARRLIQFNVKTGNPGAAQRAYDKIKAVLRDRYNLSPRPETNAALQGMGTTTPARARDNKLTAVPLRLQVRPFSAATPDVHEHAQTFRSELMAGLACFRGWSVVEGVQTERDSDHGSDYAVTLSQPANDASRIDIGLAEIATQRLVWSDTVDLSTGRVEASRRQVVGRIAATLEVFITTDRTVVASADHRNDVVDDWLRGERLIGRWTTQAHDEAATIFSSNIERAAEYAPAYASLASVLNVRHVVRPGLQRDAHASRRAHDLADQALELDPLDARNQLAAGWSAALDEAFDKASVNFDMATRLNPHSPRTLMSCAMGFSFLGEHARAAEFLAHSLECAPVLLDYQWCYAASVYLLAGNAEAALEAAQRSGNKIIDNPGWTAAALVRLGRRSEAAVAYSQLVRDVSANWHGPEPPTPHSVQEWFVTAYPFRNATERDLLDSALSEAVHGLNRPLDEA